MHEMCDRCGPAVGARYRADGQSNNRSPTTAVAYLPSQEPEVYQGCGSTSLTH
jgi:hypothetical protein